MYSSVLISTSSKPLSKYYHSSILYNKKQFYATSVFTVTKSKPLVSVAFVSIVSDNGCDINNISVSV